MRRIGYRRAQPVDAVSVAGIVPVEPFPAGDVGRKVCRVVRRVPVRRVRVRIAVAPVAERHVVVDADRIDRQRSPKRIEVEQLVARGVGRLVARIFRPVGGVGEFRRAADHGAHICRQRHQRIDEREAVGCPAHRRQPAHLRADDEGVDPARRRRQLRVVQRHAPVVPARAAADEGRDLHGRRCRLVRRPDCTRRGVAGDSPAPGIGRLRRRPRIGIGQRIVLRHVHHDQRIERDLQPARLEIGDRRQHRCVRGRAAIGRPAIVLRDHLCARPRQTGDRPVGAVDRARRRLDARRDVAVAAAQIIAEPGDHQRHVLEVGTERSQFVDGERPVRDLGAHMRVLACRGARRDDAHPRAGVVSELGGAGDHRHRPDRWFEFAHHAAEFHRDVGDAVAEPTERKPLEHEVAEPTIAGRLPRALHRLDQAVRQLAFGAAIEAHAQPRGLEQLPIGPDAAQPLHLALAQGHRETGDDIGLLGLGRSLRAGGFRSDFLEFCSPDDVTGEPAPAVEPRHRAALARSLQADIGAGDDFGLLGEQHAVDGRSGQGAQRPADGRADRPAQRAAHHLAGQRKCKCCHVCSGRFAPDRASYPPAVIPAKAGTQY